MSNRSIAHIFLEANPRSALVIDTGYNEMFACLKATPQSGRYGSLFQFFGRGQTVADALQALDADIAASGISVQTFSFPGHTQKAHNAACKKIFAEMHQQIAEEEAAALDTIRLTEEIGLVEALHRVEHLAEVRV